MVVAGLRRVDAVAENVMAADGVISSVKNVATPLAFEHPLDRSGFVPGVGIDGPPPFRRPANDFNFDLVGRFDEPAVTGDRFRCRRDNGDGDPFHLCGNIWRKIIRGRHVEIPCGCYGGRNSDCTWGAIRAAFKSLVTAEREKADSSHFIPL